MTLRVNRLTLIAPTIPHESLTNLSRSKHKLKLNQQEQVANGNYTPKQDRNPTSSSRDNDSSREVAEMRKELKKMSRMIAQLTRTAGISGGSSADSGDDESDTEVTNTNNPALCSRNRTSKKARFQV